MPVMSSTSSASPSPPRVPPESSARVPDREVLALDTLIDDAGTQVRSAIDDDLVLEYAEALAEGAQFPPIVVFRSDAGDLLADGFHRVRAYRKARRLEIEADVHHGGREEALWFALRANRAHGRRLSTADKRRAVELAYEAWPDLTQTQIARHVGCNQSYVSKVRAQLVGIPSHTLPDRVIRSDGRSIPATLPRRSSSESSASSSTSAVPSSGSVFSGSRSDDPPLPADDHESLVPDVHESPVMVDQPASVSTRASESPAADGPSGSQSSGSASSRGSDSSNRIVSVIVQDARSLTDQQDMVDFSELDRARIPDWTARLKVARRDLDRFIRRLQEVGDGIGSGIVED